MNPIDLLDFIAEEFNSGGFLIVDSDDLDRVALDPEVTSNEFNIVSLVLNVYQRPNQLIAIDALTDSKWERLS